MCCEDVHAAVEKQGQHLEEHPFSRRQVHVVSVCCGMDAIRNQKKTNAKHIRRL